MDFLKSSKRRSLVSELVYIGLNVTLAVAVFLSVYAIDAPMLAVGLVLLSKWRIFAVRPRYWFANLKANLVDIIVSLSAVGLLWAAEGALVSQLVLTAAYIGWLLFIKPRSKRLFVAIQAYSAIFLGVSVLMMVSYDWPVFIVVLAMWLIGLSAARHVLGSYEEINAPLYSLIWGLLIAEIGWLGYHWAFAYQLPGVGSIQLSQTALIALAFSFLAERVYSSYYHHKEVKVNDIILPILLSVSVIMLLLATFNNLSNGLM